MVYGTVRCIGSLICRGYVYTSTVSSGFVIVYALPGLFGLALYGIVFGCRNEARIPAAVMATAVGIASIIGYAPDFFMATMFGSWLMHLISGLQLYLHPWRQLRGRTGRIGIIYTRLKNHTTRQRSKLCNFIKEVSTWIRARDH